MGATRSRTIDHVTANEQLVVHDVVVTIIVPVFNAIDYLAACVHSILSQSHRNLQVILIDDGSTDGSGDLCDDLALEDDRILVIHQSNAGIGAAQNTGLDAATGSLITFCDNDDLMAPQMIERLTDALLSSGADMSCCRWENVGASRAERARQDAAHAPPGEITVFRNPAESYQTVFSVALRRLCRSEARYFSEANWGKLYRAELFDGIRFPVGHFAQDVSVAMPLYLRMASVASCSDVLYLWLQRGDSVSHSIRATSYYSDIVHAHARSFESAISRRILPARAYFGLTALRLERRSVRTADDTDTYRADRALVRSLHSRLNPYQRLLCMSLSLLRSAEVLVYNRSVHRRR